MTTEKVTVKSTEERVLNNYLSLNEIEQERKDLLFKEFFLRLEGVVLKYKDDGKKCFKMNKDTSYDFRKHLLPLDSKESLNRYLYNSQTYLEFINKLIIAFVNTGYKVHFKDNDLLTIYWD